MHHHMWMPLLCTLCRFAPAAATIMCKHAADLRTPSSTISAALLVKLLPLVRDS